MSSKISDKMRKSNPVLSADAVKLLGDIANELNSILNRVEYHGSRRQPSKEECLYHLLDKLRLLIAIEESRKD